MGETDGDGDCECVGDVLGTPGVVAGGAVGEGTVLELGSSVTSQWVPVAPVPVQSHTGPILPTTHTPGPHTIEEQPVTCETRQHTQATVPVIAYISAMHGLVHTDKTTDEGCHPKVSKQRLRSHIVTYLQGQYRQRHRV